MPEEPTDLPTESIEEAVKFEVPTISESPVSEPSQIQPPSEKISTSLPTETDPVTAEIISQLRSDLETCESRRIEESQQAASRIDSLEQKLKILSDLSRESCNELASNPAATTFDRKLAEREEKIALLLDEGLPPSS
jgi:hypothetical protein